MTSLATNGSRSFAACRVVTLMPERSRVDVLQRICGGAAGTDRQPSLHSETYG